MKMLLIDWGREEESIVHRVLVDEGRYLMPKKLRGDFPRQADELVLLAYSERPEKIVFDEFGIGVSLRDHFLKRFSSTGAQLLDNGTVVY